ncbi:MAG TPA: type VI secretion system tube protein Hcp [Gaiellaceae bacterium]|nr:type VI secretion system tube protein Hcp [Gaiellaceae bacterium]
MAVDMFLRIDEIPGGSTDAQHKGEIDVLGYSFGVTQTGTLATGGAGAGAGAGKPSFADLVVSCSTSKASPELLVACASGRHLKSAVLTCRRRDPKPHEFSHIELGDVIITSYQSAGSDGEVPVDQISLAYGMIRTTYSGVNKSGKPKPPVTGGWDLRNTKA